MRYRKKDQSLLAWWAILGVGLGLIVLSAVIWATRSPDGERIERMTRDIRRLEPVLVQLRQGSAPTPEMMAAAQNSTLAPLLSAMADAHRQRQQALTAYQTQIESVALGDWLTPANLISAPGRATVRQRLVQLQSALEGLIRRDAAVQSRLDDAISGWLQEAPSWGDAAWRRQLLSSSAVTAQTMTAFFKVERDIMTRVDDLLQHLDRLGNQVTLENGAQQELVFASEAELGHYRATLASLGDLGRREQELLLQAQQSSGQHARRVGELLLASVTNAP